MNSALNESHLVSFEHMNRAQKRAFILRDQLKYDEEQHLDVFIDGICNPEPPRYKRTGRGIQPPYEEVAVKHSTTRFDLGNVEFSDKSVRRVHLACVGDSYEMHDSDAISPDEDDFNSVPLNYYVAQNIMPGFKKKYEAIHARVQRINDLRQHMYERARNRPLKTSSRFKEGKSLAKLMDPAKDVQTTQSGEESRKRSGDFVNRHPLNKKKRIGLENVSSNIKTEAVNRIPDQTKVDLFNAFVKSAFPDFDNLLMASWNVVSIFVNVGSEDLMLHNSIGDLHEVLMKFDHYFGKTRKTRPNNNGAASTRNDVRNDFIRNTPLAQRFGGSDGVDDVSQNHSSDRLIELPPGTQNDVDDEVYILPRNPFHAIGSRPSSSRHEGEHRSQKDQRQHRSRLDQQQRQSLFRQPDAPDQSSTNELASRNRLESHVLPQSLGDLISHRPKKEVRRGMHNELRTMVVEVEGDTVSSIEEGFDTVQTQGRQTPLKIEPVKKPSPTEAETIPKHLPANSYRRLPEHAQFAIDAAEHRNRTIQQQSPPPREAQRYGMFSGHARHNSIDALFVTDDDDEAVQVSAMQEVHDQEKAAELNTLSLGKSILGAPKKPANLTGPAPVAPMMHNNPTGKKDETERRPG